MIALERRETDNINRMMTMTGYFYILVCRNVLDHNKQLITLTMITMGEVASSSTVLGLFN